MLQKYFFAILLTAFVISCKDESPAASTRGDNMALGNPSDAGGSDENNYLITKPQYVLSYSSERGTANWVSWHLSAAWRGTATRSDNFRSDGTLPSDFYRVKSDDYTGSGFDRGHLCPSDDRNGSAADNEATFLMTNIVPQSPNSNRGPWVDLETYCRKILASGAGNELYIIAGVGGQGGSGSNGGTTKTLADGNIIVPAYLWKVIVVLPVGQDDLNRISGGTRVIAVRIPNKQSIEDNWGKYRVSIDELENALGYDFLSRVSASLQRQLEGRVDNGAVY